MYIYITSSRSTASSLASDSTNAGMCASATRAIAAASASLTFSSKSSVSLSSHVPVGRYVPAISAAASSCVDTHYSVHINKETKP